MPALIPVTSTPQKISGTASKPYLISNDPSSVSTIYLGQDSSVSPYNYGVKLASSGSLTWTEITKEVWAVTDAGGSAKVSVMYEASGTFSSQISSVSANQPTLLQTITIPFAGGSGAPITMIPDTLIQNYSSLKVSITTNLTVASGVGNLSSLANGAYVRFVGIQSDTALGNPSTPFTTIFSTNEAQWTFGDGRSQSTGLQKQIATLEFPIINNFLTGSYIEFSSGTSNPTGTFTVKIFGQGAMLTETVYRNYPDTGSYPVSYIAQSGLMFNATGQTAPTSSNVEIPSENGLANILTSSSATTLTRMGWTLYAYKGGSQIILGKRISSAPATVGDSTIDQIILPSLPIVFRLELTGTGTANFTITQIN